MAKKRLTKKQRARRILKLRILILASLAAIAALVVLIVKSAGYDLINENDPVATIRLKNGDKVMTAGGIYGTVAEVADRTVIIKVDGEVKLRVDKNSLVRDYTQDTPAPEYEDMASLKKHRVFGI